MFPGRKFRAHMSLATHMCSRIPFQPFVSPPLVNTMMFGRYNTQLPVNSYSMPKFNYQKGVGTAFNAGFNAETGNHKLPLDEYLHKCMNPNVHACTYCNFSTKGSPLATCPAGIMLGYNWKDVRDPELRWIPVVLYGKNPNNTSTPLQSRMIKGCRHHVVEDVPVRSLIPGGYALA